MANIAKEALRRSPATQAGILLLLLVGPLRSAPLDEMAVARWAKLREVERFQLNIAEKLYKQKQWKVAMAEYEKYLKYRQFTPKHIKETIGRLCRIVSECRIKSVVGVINKLLMICPHGPGILIFLA